MDQLKIAFKELENWNRDDLEVMQTVMLILFSQRANMIVSIVQVIIQIILVQTPPVVWNNNQKKKTNTHHWFWFDVIYSHITWYGWLDRADKINVSRQS